ncbi:50S ribosomal protein L5 [Candidatus Woesearchaeota archaeon]|nr:50S ribosomal protein L5 [Candidatus Woesearchaeota archaeon]
MNPMRTIKVEKLTLNIGAGKDTKLLEKGMKLIESLTGTAPVKTITQKRIPGWGLRPGLPIGCKLTLRGKKAEELIPRLLAAKENNLSKKNFDDAGNISFGVPEYIDIEGAVYDPKIGIIGLQVCITLVRPGYRVKSRSLRPARIRKQRLVRDEAVVFMKEKFKTTVE